MGKKLSYIICMVCLIAAMIMAVLDSGIIQIKNIEPDAIYPMANKNIDWD